jgi:hypothetical protein
MGLDTETNPGSSRIAHVFDEWQYGDGPKNGGNTTDYILLRRYRTIHGP